MNAARLSFIGLGQTPVVAVSYFAVSLILISYAKFSTATTKAPADTAERAPAGLPEPAV